MAQMSLRFVLALAAVLTFAPATAGEIAFKPYARGSFAQLRKQHEGRRLIVHFWSAACPPCLAEFSEWAKIAGELQSVDIVFVNADRDDERARAERRLDRAGLSNLVHYGFADDFVERLYFEVDNSWRGELPFTALIGADGKLITVTGPIDRSRIADWSAKAQE
jgi:thiol-disulfide isomerase/thioredoxin